MRATDTKALVRALRVLVKIIETNDGVSDSAIAESAQRIDDLAELAKEMAGMLAHEWGLRDDCKACAMQKRLADLGVVA